MGAICVSRNNLYNQFSQPLDMQILEKVKSRFQELRKAILKLVATIAMIAFIVSTCGCFCCFCCYCCCCAPCRGGQAPAAATAAPPVPPPVAAPAPFQPPPPPQAPMYAPPQPMGFAPPMGRLMLMSARQPGLANVYASLLGFAGAEFYVKLW